MPVKLTEKFEVGEHASIFRFELPDAAKPLGVPLLNYVKVKV
jgi:hypothetical protein